MHTCEAVLKRCGECLRIEAAEQENTYTPKDDNHAGPGKLDKLGYNME